MEVDRLIGFLRLLLCSDSHVWRSVWFLLRLLLAPVPAASASSRSSAFSQESVTNHDHRPFIKKLWLQLHGDAKDE